MKKYVIISLITTAILAALYSFNAPKTIDVNELRKLYSSGDYSKWPKAILEDNAKQDFRDIGNLDSVKFPSDNLYNPDKAALGKILFFDPRLSVSGQIACASCHDPQLGWGDGKRVANGHDRQLGRRNAMTIFNTAYYHHLFWDGRAFSLEDQARFPVSDHAEMNMDISNLDSKINKYNGYKPLFEKAFGNEEITRDKIFKAIATFERTIVSPKSRFDLFIRGNSKALTDDEVMGLHIFRTNAGCINCHNTPLFSDNKFHNDGQTLFGTEDEDLGRYNVTKNTDDVGKFRTPSLREVANTGPWMHNGNFPTLKDVIFLYNNGNPAPIQRKYKGDRDSLLPKTDPMLKKLNLSQLEMNQLIAFLQSITTTPRRVAPPVNFPQ